MRIALIDYGAGNLTSVRKALEHLGARLTTPASPLEVKACSALIVPGVGNFEATAALAHGWKDAVIEAVDRGIPLLGICLGLQWLFDASEEAPSLPGLGIMQGECAFIRSNGYKGLGAFKVPHVGWNSLHIKRPSWLVEGVREGDQVYFTHSYAAPVTADCVASTTYGVEFASIVEHRHVVAVQFHPEKSGEVGLRILRNFLNRVHHEELGS